MTTEVTSDSAPVEQTSAVAPQIDAQPAEPVQQATQAPAAQQPLAGDAPAQTEAEDYSYVPKFYMKDGKPDFKGLATAYTELNAKFSSGVRGSFAPKDVAEYEWAPPEGVELVGDLSYMDELKADLQKHNVSKEAYGFLMSKHVEAVSKTVNDVLAQTIGNPETNRATLEQEWGEHFDTGVQNARRAFKTLMPGHDANDPILNHPTVMRLLAQIGSTLGEDSAVPDSKFGAAPTMNPEEVRQLMSSPEYYSNPEVQKKVTMFFERGGRI